VIGLTGLYVGILGLIVAVGSSDASRNSGNALAFAGVIWLIGWVFILGAYVEASRSD